MIVLWTDALIFLLIVVVAALAFYLRGREHIKRPLQKIAHSKIGMVSLVVLLFFVWLACWTPFISNLPRVKATRLSVFWIIGQHRSGNMAKKPIQHRLPPRFIARK